MTRSTLNSLTWATPILATLTAVFDAGHLTHLIGSEVTVLILAVLTAITGFVAAMSKPDEGHEQVHQFQPPQAAQQPPQPQKK